MSDEQSQPTGVAELDTLLNLKCELNPSGGFPERITTILIRGGQGAGKTTLALQILSNQLLRSGPNNYGLFLSLERPAIDTLNYMRDCFGLFTQAGKSDIKINQVKGQDEKLTEPNTVYGIDGDDFRTNVDFSLKSINRTNKVLNLFFDALDAISTIVPPFHKWLKELLSKEREEKEQAAKIAIREHLASAIMLSVDKDKLEKIPQKDKEQQIFWLVVDSLNVLERTIYLKSEQEKYRAAMQGFAKSLQKSIGMKVVIVFTGEYHTADHDVSGASGESFFCDIEILLSQEPLVGIARTDPRNSAAAGYNIELHESPKAGKDTNNSIAHQVIVETRPFCRVLKSRFSEHQSRRCYYQIEKRKGLLFDEAFPGDGYVLLFEDNPRQREAWHDFLLKDGPHEFPALRYELFDRTHQQRVFSTERCFSGHHHATDMRLINLDTYWIKWFIELNQRSIIRENMRPLKRAIEKWLKDPPDYALPVKKDIKTKYEKRVRERFSKAICLIHKVFLSTPQNGPAPEFSRTKKTFQNLVRYGKSYSFDQVFPGINLPKLYEKCWEDFCKTGGILVPISENELRLFGEQRSEILSTLLSKQKFIEIDKDKDDPKLLSIPINANISFLVYRKDLLSGLARQTTERAIPGTPCKDLKQQQRDLWDKVGAILNVERKDIKTFIESFWSQPKVPIRWKDTRNPNFKFPPYDTYEAPTKDFPDLIASQRVKSKLPELLSESYVPRTWEEIIALCDIYNWEHLIETRSFDTLLCTFLELVWGCGAVLKVDAEYKIEKLDDDFLARFYQAVFLFQELLKHVPADATLDADDFGKRAQCYPNAKKQDWAFMRQWHSTLVDVLVAKNKDGQYCWRKKEKAKTNNSDALPSDSTPELEITPLPESFWQFYQHANDDQNESGKAEVDEATFVQGKGISCWGDWHLAVLRGSENTKLAVSLLNNLMSSSKVATRALSGAALPTVEDFYEIYNLDPCVHLPERVEDFQMPTTSYGKLKDEFFTVARTRSDIFDYRHVMREIHGFVVELVYNRHPRKSPELVGKSLVEVFKRIEALSERELLSH